LIVPWKPLPIETPETLTRSPGSKLSTVTVSPGVLGIEVTGKVVPRGAWVHHDPLVVDMVDDLGELHAVVPAPGEQLHDGDHEGIVCRHRGHARNDVVEEAAAMAGTPLGGDGREDVRRRLELDPDLPELLALRPKGR